MNTKKSSLIALVLAVIYVSSSIYSIPSFELTDGNSLKSSFFLPGYFLWIVGTLLAGFFGAILGYFVSVGAFYLMLNRLIDWLVLFFKKKK